MRCIIFILMVKNRCERYLSKHLKQSKSFYLKLQTNQLCFKTNPADYLVFKFAKRFLVECKECNGKYFDPRRLTQEGDLKNFVNYNTSYDKPYNGAYILLLFWNKSLKKSNLFLININKFLWAKENCEKKFFKLDYCIKTFKQVSFDEVFSLL